MFRVVVSLGAALLLVHGAAARAGPLEAPTGSVDPAPEASSETADSPDRPAERQVPVSAETPPAQDSAKPTSDPAGAPGASVAGSTGLEDASLPSEALSPAEPAVPSLAITQVKTEEKGFEGKARGLSAILATRLSRRACRVLGPDSLEALLGPERTGRLGTCAEPDCISELSRAAGATHLLRSRVDRFGRGFVLTSELLDGTTGAVVRRERADAGSEGDLPEAADELADLAAEALGLAEATKPETPPISNQDFHFNVKLGNTLPSLKGFTFESYTLTFDGEIDYYIRPFLSAFLEVGLVFGTAEASQTGDKGSFSLLPVSGGLKYIFRADQRVRPYVGLGLGLGILSAMVQPTDRRLGLHFNGVTGLAWLPWRRVGFNFEASVDLDTLKVTEGSNLLFGLNYNFGVLALW